MKNPINIRPAQASDLTFMIECAEETYAQYVEAIGKKPAPMIFNFADHLGKTEIDVIEDGSMLVGFIVWELRDDCLFLDNIAVSTQAQGQGIARKAMRYLENKARASGKEAIELYTNEKMIANLTLYPHLGFVETRRVSEDGFKRVYFRKSFAKDVFYNQI